MPNKSKELTILFLILTIYRVYSTILNKEGRTPMKVFKIYYRENGRMENIWLEAETEFDALADFFFRLKRTSYSHIVEINNKEQGHA